MCRWYLLCKASADMNEIFGWIPRAVTLCVYIAVSFAIACDTHPDPTALPASNLGEKTHL